MTGQRLNIGELAAGGVVMAIGIAAVAIASTYPLGSITRMGPGYAPIAMGVLLVIFGAAICVEARHAPRETVDMQWRPFVFIMGGILFWALSVNRLGLVPATFVLALCCTWVEKDRTLLSMLGTAVGLCLIGYLVFIRGLNLPLQAFRF